MFQWIAFARALSLVLLTGLLMNTANAAQDANSQLDEAINRLKSASLQERRKAAESVREILVEMELESPEQVDAAKVGSHLSRIAEIIQNKQEDSEVRANLVHSVAYVKALPADASKTLVNVALDETDDAEVRSTIIMILRGLVPDDLASHAIVRATESTSWMVRANAFPQLSRLKLPGDEMLKIVERGINDPNAGVRMSAVDPTLFLAETEPRALPLVIKALNDADEGVRSKTVMILPHSEIDAGSLNEELEKLLKSEDASTRVSAAVALMTISKDVSEHLDVLTDALKSDDASIRATAAMGLGQIGRPAKAAAEVLARALEDKEVNVRIHAAFALAQMAEDAKPYIEVLGDALSADDEQAWYWATSYLTLLAAKHKELVQQRMLKSARDDDPRARGFAVALLSGLADQPVMIEVALAALDDKDPGVRAAGLNAFLTTEQLGRDQKRVLEKVKELTSDKDENVRTMAKSVIQKLTAGSDQSR